jgi:hypothetical protein
MITGHPGHEAGVLVVPSAGVIACGMGGSESGTQSHDGGGKRKGVWEGKVVEKGVSERRVRLNLVVERDMGGETRVWGNKRARLNLMAGWKRW